MRKRLETNCNKCATSNTTERYGDHTTVIQKDEKDAEQVKITAQIVQEILNSRIDRIERKKKSLSIRLRCPIYGVQHLLFWFDDMFENIGFSNQKENLELIVSDKTIICRDQIYLQVTCF